MGSLLRPMRRLLAHAQRCMAHWPLPPKAPTHLQAMVVGSVPVGVGATQLKIAPLTCSSGRELLQLSPHVGQRAGLFDVGRAGKHCPSSQAQLVHNMQDLELILVS